MSENKGGSQYRLVLGDCLEKLKELPDCSVDAVVTDPPYDLTGASGSGGFMGKKWDATGIAFRPDVWLECLRVLKPGGHLLAFGGTRTYHRMACAIEDAGFEVRDSIHWMYGSGFPKSLDVSKAIDKRRDDRADVLRVTAWIRERRDAAGVTNAEIDAAFGFCGMAGHWTSSVSQPSVPTLDQIPTLLSILGVSEEDVPAEIRRLLFELNGRKGQPGEAFLSREIIQERTMTQGGGTSLQLRMGEKRDVSANITAPATDDARTWLGWGTALKPAHEPIVVARKPLIGTVAQNVLEHGTGAINVDGCRVGTDTVTVWATKTGESCYGQVVQTNADKCPTTSHTGRWPPNVIFSHLPECSETECAEGCAVRELDEQSGASRFFPAFRYQAKAPSKERKVEGISAQHPTQKPVELMRWLVRLVTPPGGVVLDPFTGSGTTGVAAIREGFHFLGIEREAEYEKIARARISAEGAHDIES